LRGICEPFAALYRDPDPEDLELRAWTYDEIPVIEYNLDVLQYGNDEAKYHCKKAATNGSTF
jgi:hypothetical protein